MRNESQLLLYRNILAKPEQPEASGQLPPNICKWLQHTDSLTQKLQQICQKLTVEITLQGWQAVSPEWKELEWRIDSTAWIREVILKGDDDPWIFAQTRLPKHTVDKVAQAVLTLGEQPIGLWLFQQQPRRLALSWWQDPQTGLYARRSLLTIDDYPLEIKELFLKPFKFPSVE